MSDNLIFLTGRISFPWIVDPQQQKNDKGEVKNSYNCDIILAPNDPGFQKFMANVQAIAVEKWKENAGAALQQVQMDRKKRCYGDGSEKVSSKDFKPHVGYPGNVYVSARSDKQPQIIGLDGKQVDPTNTMLVRATASKIYGGCWVNVVVKPWAQQNAHGVGIRCDLVAIQFSRDDTAFGTAPVDTSGMFGAVAQPAGPSASGGMPAFGAPTGFAAPAAPGMPAAPFGAPAAPAMFGGAPQVPSFLGQ